MGHDSCHDSNLCGQLANWRQSHGINSIHRFIPLPFPMLIISRGEKGNIIPERGFEAMQPPLRIRGTSNPTK